jgi:hypothetical protein
MPAKIMRLRNCRFGGAILGMAVLGLLHVTGSEARAGILSLVINANGVPIDVNSLALVSTANQVADVDLPVLNALLAGVGSAYSFTSLGASSNNPGGTSAQLNVTGSLAFTNPGGSTSLSLTETESDFTAPTGAPNTLTSASAGTFIGEPTGGHTMSSNINGSTFVPSYNVFSAGTGANAGSGSGNVAVSLASPYTLSNVLNFALSPGATDNFSGAALVGVTTLGAVAPPPPPPPPPPATGAIALVINANGVPIPLDPLALVSTSNQVQVDVTALNALLAAVGSAYSFTALDGSSNNPGGTSAQLNLTGSLAFTNPGGSTSLSLAETQSGFTAPTGAPNTLTSASAGTFIGEPAGVGHTASSGINGSTFVPSYSVFSDGSDLDAATGSGGVPVSLSSPYSLSNVLNFALPLGATDDFSDAAMIGATPSVPEPATLTMLATGAVGLAVAYRRRRRA